MIIEKKLQNIVTKLKQENTPELYIKSTIKEYLQSYVLNFIYGDSTYGDKFIFTGGTCLRKVYGINRLSEDLDFDTTININLVTFVEELKKYFEVKYLFKKLFISIKQQGRQVLLKFDILRELGLTQGQESPMLYVKIDVTKLVSLKYSVNIKLLNDFDFSYIAKYYDIETLMTNKILAILYRTRFWGTENAETVKGRDFFDLLWFLEKRITPNYDRAAELICTETQKQNLLPKDIIKMLDDKVGTTLKNYKEDLKRDLTPFISNTAVLGDFIGSYLENYNRESSYLRV